MQCSAPAQQSNCKHCFKESSASKRQTEADKPEKGAPNVSAPLNGSFYRITYKRRSHTLFFFTPKVLRLNTLESMTNNDETPNDLTGFLFGNAPVPKHQKDAVCHSLVTSPRWCCVFSIFESSHSTRVRAIKNLSFRQNRGVCEPERCWGKDEQFFKKGKKNCFCGTK